jgi:hypothetical protein
MSEELQEWTEAVEAMASHGEWFSGQSTDPSEYREKVRRNAATLTEVAAYLRDGGWLPIESATDPLEDCLVWAEGYGQPVLAFNRPWRAVANDTRRPLEPQPTHWQPLPAPPAALAAPGGEE